MSGFSSSSLAVRSCDGRNFTLLEPVTYTARDGQAITVPTGATTDGASTPRAIWNILPPFGQYWLAAVLHDYLYRFSALPKERCDALLLEAMQSLGVHPIDAETIYCGVCLGGASSFETDRATQSLTLAIATNK